MLNFDIDFNKKYCETKHMFFSFVFRLTFSGNTKPGHKLIELGWTEQPVLSGPRSIDPSSQLIH